MNEGFIFLHRKFKDWEWYKNIPVKTLFQHCLIMANFKDKKWQGIEIKRGSFITSIKTLSIETGLTERQVRTALDKLKLTNEVTIKSNNKYSVVTVLNYNTYQANDKQEVKQKSDERRAADTPATTTNKDNTINNGNNEDTLFVRATELIREEFRRPLTIEEVQIIEQWVEKDKFTYDEIYDALFYIIKTEGHREDIKYMYGILKNRREQNNG